MMALPFLLVMACDDGAPDDYGPPVGTTPDFYGHVPRNLLVISVDTTRRTELGALGGPGALPYLDQLAEEGVLWANHRTCSSWTFGGTTCTQLGRMNIEAGIFPRIGESTRAPVPDDTPMLPTWLGELGFYSVLISSNNWFSAKWQNDQGFDYSEKAEQTKAANIFARGLEILEPALDSGAADRWYLHLHLIEPHVAYNPPEEYLADEAALPPVDHDFSSFDAQYTMIADWSSYTEEEQELLTEHMWVRYRGDLSWMDDQVRDAMADLDSRGLLDDTLVVIWNDHGEAFWEHGYQTHAYTLHSEENDGFVIFWAKNIVPARWDEPTSSIDLVPTLLRLYGYGDGQLPPEVTGYPMGEAPPDRPIFGETAARIGPQQSIEKEGWKLIYDWNGSLWLYDRNTDFFETTDLFDPTSQQAIDLWNELRPMVEAAEPLVTDKSPVWPELGGDTGGASTAP